MTVSPGPVLPGCLAVVGADVGARADFPPELEELLARVELRAVRRPGPQRPRVDALALAALIQELAPAKSLGFQELRVSHELPAGAQLGPRVALWRLTVAAVHLREQHAAPRVAVARAVPLGELGIARTRGPP
ncbi:MAG TPA: hypothetical protein VME44_13725 [Streptosporangiaceae bacterium]|nr:hypothetical protein [Streptosporangiaceae bacterium]